ncbi:uncharacterized protein Dana_GF15445, isoform D [Drosophila ananassae]|uniref:Uncharacterized protein, isoform C n=1 Tax=Drosophila ananassae TaxID=7217 RepID=A0A0P9BNV1_DROAN|nr:uncharacterized protein LOC6498253 isoform X2 [Drosophila ananassae]KPU73515.1 uncharacterized protein Dana_GF15445, isoform C [Drosophila ananassae]KPU73516.1 uncharacterized protein Dana_GF15445, isoform D [Drosophila ananassae]
MLHSNCDNATSKPTTTEPTTTSTAAVAPIAGDAAIATVEGQTMTLVPSMDLPSSAVSERSELSETADSAAASAASTTAAAAAAAFNAQMRTQQRQKIKSYHDAKQTAVWRTDSLASNPSPDFAAAAGGGGVGPGGGFGGGGGPSRGNVCAGLPMRSIILSTAPSLLQRKASDSSLVGGSIPRRVSFPENELVTGYLEPANPWKQVYLVKNNADVVDQYVQSCQKHNTEPIKNVMDQLRNLDLHQARQPLLSLKEIKMRANDCEALEEIFKRVQYKCIDLSDCTLDENCLTALFQMIEYYEAANELDISYNKEQMTKRCWELCAYMVGRSQELQSLNAECNQITKLGAVSLGHALGTSNLHTLKLEHCGLSGQPLINLCRGLNHNKMLKELWMGYNDLDCVDAQHIADMLRFNHSMELIDISNNNIRNEGVMYLVQALVLQSTELERRMGALKRTRAIEVDECTSPVEADPPSVISESANSSSSSPEKDNVDNVSSLHTSVQPCPETLPEEEAADEPVLVDLDNDNDDDNTEDTVRIVKTSGPNGGSGQSMLDKLLSMNSDSSSEEAPSNISTDTLAACCSEDISEISNEIFDATAAKQPPPEAVKEASPAEGPSEADAALSADTATHPAPVSEEPLSPAQQQQQQHSSQNERNLCDITPSTEAKTVEPNESCVQNNIINNNNNNNQAHNNTYNNNNTPSAMGAEAGAVATIAVVDAPPTAEIGANNRASPPAAIFEVTAEESDCINGSRAGASGSRPLDVNKNAKVGDDFEDTHSTDSAFESASEGDISRNLPDEFSRLSVSLESTRLDMGGIETGTIASESTECLLLATTPTKADEPEVFSPPKVTISEESLLVDKDLSPGPFSCPSPAPTPPPPSTSPGGASIGLRRTESSCAYLNQSTRNRSQSSDSLCSETSQDSSTAATAAGVADPKLAEKLTKNDTLSRRQQMDCTLEAIRSPSGLKALTVWNNNLTKDCAPAVSELLQKTISLELLNIGKNCLSNDFVATIKDSLTKNTTLTTLGLQSAHLSAKGIETLASILTFGGNSKLQRIDIRDNKLEVESLNIIAEVLKSNKTLTQIDINDEPKRLTIGSDAHLDYTRVLGTVRSLCSRNEKRQAQELADRTANVGGGGSSAGGSFPGSRCRGGYYLGSRKISLTCHSRPFVDAATGTVIAKPGANATASGAATATPTPAALLEVKRKGGSRLRSPGPSPPTVSPSSSPNRSRFHVSRVPEVASPLMSPLAQPPHPHAPLTPRSASSCMSIPTIAGSPGGSQSSLNTVGALPTSSSLPAMASVTSSTQTIKRLSVSPRSRFHVSRIYEDPQVPMANRQMPPITPHTPPLDLPPTPMLKSARKAVQLTEAVEAAAAAVPASSVVILEPSDSHGDTLDNSTKADEAAGQKLSSNSPTLSTSSSTSPASSNSSGSNSNGTSSITSTDSIISGPEANPPPLLTCPLAVFGDNDITLTKESAAVVAGHLNPVLEARPAPEPAPPSEPVTNPPIPARKTSWIANPSAVDKLLTIFNTGNIFQRSSSPESKASQVSASAVTNNSQNGGTATSGGASGGDGSSTTPNPNLSVARKISPASWTSLTGSNISNSSQNATSNVETSSSSILETASRQLRDFSKQVFRQNISFNNSGDAASSGTVASLEGISTATSSSSSTESPSPPECNAAHMPSSLKRQLKENISPEHTINEETLHTLQKLSRAEDVALKAEAAAELGDIEIVMHSEVVDCRLPEEKQEEQEEAAQSLV